MPSAGNGISFPFIKKYRLCLDDIYTETVFIHTFTVQSDIPVLLHSFQFHRYFYILQCIFHCVHSHYESLTPSLNTLSGKEGGIQILQISITLNFTPPAELKSLTHLQCSYLLKRYFQRTHFLFVREQTLRNCWWMSHCKQTLIT